MFQGTVLGQPLRNVFYADAAQGIRNVEFEEVVFADDLNAFRSFPLAVPNEQLLATGASCQRELRRRGSANQVAFDPDKESMHVVSFRSS